MNVRYRVTLSCHERAQLVAMDASGATPPARHWPGSSCSSYFREAKECSMMRSVCTLALRALAASQAAARRR
jgi:hypothetical protein